MIEICVGGRRRPYLESSQHSCRLPDPLAGLRGMGRGREKDGLGHGKMGTGREEGGKTYRRLTEGSEGRKAMTH